MISCQCILYRVEIKKKSYSIVSSDLYYLLILLLNEFGCHCSLAGALNARAENLIPRKYTR